jgi:hypothetical protein
MALYDCRSNHIHVHGAGTFSDYPPQIFLDHVPEGDEPEAEMGAHDWEDAGPQSKSVTLSPGERAAPLLCVLCACARAACAFNVALCARPALTRLLLVLQVYEGV